MANHKQKKRRPQISTMTSLADLAKQNPDLKIQELRMKIQANSRALKACETRLAWKLQNGQQKQVRQLMNRRDRIIKEQEGLVQQVGELLERKEGHDQERT